MLGIDLVQFLVSNLIRSYISGWLHRFLRQDLNTTSGFRLAGAILSSSLALILVLILVPALVLIVVPISVSVLVVIVALVSVLVLALALMPASVSVLIPASGLVLV